MCFKVRADCIYVTSCFVFQVTYECIQNRSHSVTKTCNESGLWEGDEDPQCLSKKPIIVLQNIYANVFCLIIKNSHTLPEISPYCRKATLLVKMFYKSRIINILSRALANLLESRWDILVKRANIECSEYKLVHEVLSYKWLGYMTL